MEKQKRAQVWSPSLHHEGMTGQAAQGDAETGRGRAKSEPCLPASTLLSGLWVWADRVLSALCW